MNNGIYSKVLLTLIALCLLFFGIFFINSVDTLSARMEMLVVQTEKISRRLSTLETQFPKGQQTVLSAKEAFHAPTSFAREEIANSEFYPEEAQPGGRSISAIGTDTKNMNYLINNEATISSIWSYCTSSLAERNYEHVEKWEPLLAESWKISEDKKTYTVKLKKGVLWHDFTDPVTGKEWKDMEVTAADFKFYIDVIKNEDTNCAPSRTYLQDLDKIEIINDYEFKVCWNKRYFLSESITLSLEPLPRHLYHAYEGSFDGKKFNNDHERNKVIVGCGPYRFVKWDKDQRVILKRWDKYFGQRYGVAPALELLVFEVIKHPNTRLQALISKDIDRIGLTPEQWVQNTDRKEFRKSGFLRKMKYPSMSYSYIGYNQKNPLFKDRSVRVALTHLVDRERILKEVYFDLGRIVTGNFFIDSPYYDKSIEPYPFSVEKALELFKQAGWTDTDGDGILDKDGKKFEFTMLSVPVSSIQKKMLPIIQEDMAKAGVVMNIQNIEWSVYLQRLEKKSFDSCVLMWGMGFDSDPYQIWHSSQADQAGSSNHISFKSPEADKLIEEIRVTFDLKKRIELCHQFHQLLHKEQPYTFLISPYALLSQNNRYHNVRIFPGGVPVRIMWVPDKEQLTVPGIR